MFSPPSIISDSLLFAVATGLGTAVNPSFATAIVSATVSGIFLILAKGLGLYIKARQDKQNERKRESRTRI
jgi:hypothetical protein